MHRRDVNAKEAGEALQSADIAMRMPEPPYVVQWTLPDGSEITAFHYESLKDLVDGSIQDDYYCWSVHAEWSWGDTSVLTDRPHSWGQVINIVASSIRAVRDHSPEPEEGGETRTPMSTLDRATGHYTRGVEHTPQNPPEAYPWVHYREEPILYDYRETFPEGTLIDGNTIDDAGTEYAGSVDPTTAYIVVSVPHATSPAEHSPCVVPDWLTYEESREHAKGHSIRKGTRLKIVREHTVRTVELTHGNIQPRHVRDAGYDMPPKSSAPGYGDLCRGCDVNTGETVIFDGGEIVAVENTEDETIPRTAFWGALEDVDTPPRSPEGYTRYKELCQKYDYDGAPRPSVVSTEKFGFLAQ